MTPTGIRASSWSSATWPFKPSREPPGDETFGEVAGRYLKYQKARLSPKGYDREERIFRVHLAPFHSLKLTAIRKADIQRYVTDRAAKASPYSVRKELVAIKHLFSLAVEREIIPINPAQGVKAPKLPAGRVRYLQPTELRALLEACPEGLRQIVALAVSTGMRRGEAIPAFDSGVSGRSGGQTRRGFRLRFGGDFG